MIGPTATRGRSSCTLAAASGAIALQRRRISAVVAGASFPLVTRPGAARDAANTQEARMPATGETRTTIETALIVDQALHRASGVTVRELCDELGCHPKTVRRRLAWLRLTFGVAIRLVGGFGLERRYVYPNGEAGVFSERVRRRSST